MSAWLTKLGLLSQISLAPSNLINDRSVISADMIAQGRGASAASRGLHLERISLVIDHRISLMAHGPHLSRADVYDRLMNNSVNQQSI